MSRACCIVLIVCALTDLVLGGWDEDRARRPVPGGSGACQRRYVIAQFSYLRFCSTSTEAFL